MKAFAECIALVLLAAVAGCSSIPARGAGPGGDGTSGGGGRTRGGTGADGPTGTGVDTTCAHPESTWIWCDDFEKDRLSSYFEYVPDNGSFVREPGVGMNGSWGMEAHFDSGQVAAGNLKLAFGLTPSSYFKPVDSGTRKYRDVYWRFYFRRDSDWTGGGGYKLTRAMSLASSTWAEAMIAQVWSDDPPNQDYLLSDPASGVNPLTGLLLTLKYNDFIHLHWLGQVKGPMPIYDHAYAGKWLCVEVHARLDDPGRSNGVEEVWVDGRKDVDETGLTFVGSFDQYGINAIFLENYWNTGAPKAESRYFDDFIVATSRIGCGPDSTSGG